MLAGISHVDHRDIPRDVTHIVRTAAGSSLGVAHTLTFVFIPSTSAPISFCKAFANAWSASAPLRHPDHLDILLLDLGDRLC